MKQLSISRQGTSYVSETFGGGVMVQVSADSTRPLRIGIETCIDPAAGWCNLRSVMLQPPTTVFALNEYAADQQFRLTSQSKFAAVTSEIVSK